MLQFADLEHILDHDEWVKRKGYSEDDFVKTARLLFDRQFLFAYDRQTKGSYELVGHCKAYFSKLASAFGYDLIDDSMDSRMIGIVPILEDGRRRLNKEETIMLLVLAYAYHDRVLAGDIENFGCVETDNHTLADSFRTMSGLEEPQKVDLKLHLKRFKQNGLLDFEEHDDDMIAITIRPSILKVVGKDYLERLQRFGGLAPDTAAAPDPSDQSVSQEMIAVDSPGSAADGDDSVEIPAEALTNDK